MSDASNSNADAYSHIVDLSALNRTGERIRLAPDATARAAIAQRLDIPGLDELVGLCTLTPDHGAYLLTLEIEALAQRNCVVSLEPMIEHVSEKYRIRFDPHYIGDSDDEALADDLSLDSDISLEPLDGDALDLGEILVQHLSLSLSPHPRKTDKNALLDAYRTADKPSPFAALKGLIDDPA